MKALSGFGLGLRREHYAAILQDRPAVDWFEILTENYLVRGGRPLRYLEQVWARFPVVMHGVALSIGSSEPLNRRYLRDLKGLADRIEPAWISDHLIDTHDAPVAEPVWALYAQAMERFGAVPTMIERDAEIPELSVLVAELARARCIAEPKPEARAA